MASRSRNACSRPSTLSHAQAPFSRRSRAILHVIEADQEPDAEFAGVVVPLQYRSDQGVLSLFSTTTVFGTAVEVTLSELMLEAFYPADDFTGEAFRRNAASGDRT